MYAAKATLCLAVSAFLAFGTGKLHAQGVAAGQYNATGPVLSEGDVHAHRLDVRSRLITTVEKRATYSAGVIGLAVAAAATDLFCIKGASTKVIIVKHISFGGSATATTVADAVILKRSTANTGGTSTTPTTVPHDSTNPAAAAVLNAYTANPTTGTLVGFIDPVKFTLAAATAQTNERGREYGIEEDQGLVLRGSNESICLNFNGQTVSGASLDIAVEWREIVE